MDLVRVVQNDIRNCCDLLSRYFDLELVIILNTDLLHAAEGIPAVFNDIIEVSPAPIVELSCCRICDAPYLVEKPQNREFRVGLCVPCLLEAAALFEFLEEFSNLSAATWKPGNFCKTVSKISTKGGLSGHLTLSASESVRVRSNRGY